MSGTSSREGSSLLRSLLFSPLRHPHQLSLNLSLSLFSPTPPPSSWHPEEVKHEQGTDHTASIPPQPETLSKTSSSLKNVSNKTLNGQFSTLLGTFSLFDPRAYYLRASLSLSTDYRSNGASTKVRDARARDCCSSIPFDADHTVHHAAFLISLVAFILYLGYNVFVLPSIVRVFLNAKRSCAFSFPTSRSSSPSRTVLVGPLWQCRITPRWISHFGTLLRYGNVLGKDCLRLQVRLVSSRLARGHLPPAAQRSLTRSLSQVRTTS